MFSWRCSIHEMATFRGVSGTFLLQIWLKFPEISTRGTSFIRQRQSLNNLSKLSGWAEMRRTQRWWFWSISGPNLPPENPQYCQKPKFFPETTSVWLSNNTSPRSQINHGILKKLIKKPPILCAKYGLFKVKIGR